jgi:hypothetical protein
MMREIRFRAWHTKNKKMFSAEEMAADQLTLLPTGEFINVSSADTRLSNIIPQSAMIPMQYTGIKDSTGKDIYEGDILRHPSSNECFAITWAPMRCGFRADYGNKGHSDIEMQIGIRGCAFVIGNIHENPELLVND